MSILPPHESGFTATTPVSLYWARYGPAARDPLLVLHGGPGASHDYLLPQMLALAEKRELIFYDQRGGGRSRENDAAQEPITWRTHVADLAAIIAEFSLPRPTLLGYSWGALLAILYSIEAAKGSVAPPPARLVLIDPAPVTRAYRDAFEAEFARRQGSDPIKSLREQLTTSGVQTMDRDAYRRRAFELSVAGYFADPARAAGLTPFRVIGKVQTSVWSSLGDFDLRKELRNVRCPALVLHGTDDPIPLESARDVAEALGARFVRIEGAGHVPYVEQPGPLFEAIEAFLSE